MRHFALLGLVTVFGAGCGDDTGDGAGGATGTSTGDTSTTTSDTTTATTTGSTATTAASTSATTGTSTVASTTSTTTGAGPEGAVETVECVSATIAQEIGVITAAGNFVFSPSTVTLAEGDVVRFTPDGPHTMVSEDGEFSTSTNQVTCLRFNEAGSYPFYCSFHESMEGTITVE